MGKASGIPWQAIAIQSLNAGAQALLDGLEANVKLRSPRLRREFACVERPPERHRYNQEPDFTSTENLMTEISRKEFLLKYGYSYIPRDMTPPLMAAGQVPFQAAGTVVQINDDNTTINQYVATLFRGSFRVTGVEPQIVQAVTSLIVGLRSQGVSSMKSLPKRYNFPGQNAQGDSREVGFDGIIVWANVATPTGLITLVRFDMVHYEEVPALSLDWRSTADGSSDVAPGCEIYYQLDNGRGRLSIALATGSSKAFVQICTREGHANNHFRQVKLDLAESSFQTNLRLMMYGRVYVLNEERSETISVRFTHHVVAT